jgi:peptidylprolyl isomerase
MTGQDMTEVKSGDVVRIHYTGKLDDGTVFDSSQGREPLEFEVGAGQIIPGLERQVEGLTVGARETINVPALEAYGPHDDAQVQVVPRDAVPQTIELEHGARLQAQTSDGRQIALTVVDFDDTQVTLDANHPLAGKDLIFEIEIVEVLAA